MVHEPTKEEALSTRPSIVRILHLEDSQNDAELIKATLLDSRDGLSAAVQTVSTRDAYLAVLRCKACDIILADYQIPGYNGIAALEDAKALCPGVPFIMVTGTLGEEKTIETLKAGATDYVLKDHLKRLIPSIKRALEETALRREQRAKEELIARQHNELSAIVNSLNEGLNVADMQGNILRMNALGATLLGYTSEAEYRRALPEFVDTFELSYQDGRPMPFEEWPMTRLLRGERVAAYLARVRRPDTGLERYLSYNGNLALDDAGKPMYAILTYRDVTEFIQTREALRRSEEWYRTLFATMIEGFCIVEVLFDEANRPIDYRFLETNAAFERQTGMHNAQGKTMREFAPEHEAHWFETYGRIALTGVPERFENEARALGRWYEVSAFRVGEPEQRRVAILFNDISERKSAEEALRKSEQIYRAVGETIDYGVWICDTDGRNIYASPSLLKLVGMTQEECSEYGWGNYLHPDDAAETIAAWQRCAHAGTSWEREHRYRGVDGRYHYILARGIPVRDKNGTIVCWAGINLDIDEMKQKEEALRQSQEHFSAAFYGSPFPQAVSRVQDGVFLDVNNAYLTFYGLTRDEVIGRPSADLGILVDLQERQQLIALLQRDGGVHGFEMHVRSRTQGERLVLLSASLMQESNVPTMLTVFSDITERKRAEEALQRSAENMHLMVESSTNPMMVVSGEGEIEAVNGHGAILLGYQVEELVGRKAVDFIVPMSRVEMLLHLEDLRKHAPLPVTGTVRAKNKNGTQEWFTVEASLATLGLGREKYMIHFERLKIGGGRGSLVKAR